MIAKKNASDEQWKTQRQAERDNATDMQDMGVARIVSLPEAYANVHLEVQGDNPYYSPRQHRPWPCYKNQSSDPVRHPGEVEDPGQERQGRGR